MTPRPDINLLAKEIFEANKAKGFHDKEYSNEHYLCLVISELMEAVETDRKDRRAKTELFIRAESNNCDNSEKMEFFFRQYIKDTVEDKLADAIIRLLDLAGLRGYALVDVIDSKGITIFNGLPFSYSIFEVIGVFYSDRLSLYGRILKVMLYIESISRSLQIDIWRHVELKLKYNARREFKHGKEY